MKKIIAFFAFICFTLGVNAQIMRVDPHCRV